MVMTITEPNLIHKHSATLHGHRTSFSLEDEFWAELKSIAKAKHLSLAGLITEIDDQRNGTSNLSSALRLYVLRYLKTQISSPTEPDSGLRQPR
jgi:predicted DNA-binding ribbon-helix-helix protein